MHCLSHSTLIFSFVERLCTQETVIITIIYCYWSFVILTERIVSRYASLFGYNKLFIEYSTAVEIRWYKWNFLITDNCHHHYDYDFIFTLQWHVHQCLVDDGSKQTFKKWKLFSRSPCTEEEEEKGDRLTFITIDTHLTMHCVYFLKETQHVDKSKRKEKFWCVKLQGCALLRKSKEFSNFTEKLNRLNEWHWMTHWIVQGMWIFNSPTQLKRAIYF